MYPTPNSEHSDFEDALYISRGVKVNGTPPTQPFLYALAAGRVHSSQCNKTDDLIKSVTHGFLKPESSADVSVVPYTGYRGNYVIAHHLQSDYYHAHLKEQYNLYEKPFNSAVDVLLEVIPGLRLHELLVPCHRPEHSPFHWSSILPLPHEDCWNHCFRQLFGRHAGTQRSTKPGVGMPDFVCQYDGRDIVIESVIYTSISEVQVRADKFSNLPKLKRDSYQKAVKEGVINLRGLVVIGTQVEKVESLMKQVQLRETNKDLEIMGLCPVSGYRSMVFIRRTAGNECQHHTIKCNLVPQRLVDGKLVVGRTFGKTCCKMTLIRFLSHSTPLPLSHTFTHDLIRRRT